MTKFTKFTGLSGTRHTNSLIGVTDTPSVSDESVPLGYLVSNLILETGNNFLLEDATGVLLTE